MAPNIHGVHHAVGVQLARIDIADRAMNLLSVGLMDSLESLLGRDASADAVRTIVLASGCKRPWPVPTYGMVQIFAKRWRRPAAPRRRALRANVLAAGSLHRAQIRYSCHAPVPRA
ncbi:MAG: hypothetical protein ACT4P0_12050 [Panacagrimonas sp.]